MKKVILMKVIILLLGCFLSSCKEKDSGREVEQDRDMKNLILVLSVSGGTRAHIININSKNELSYRVGTFYIDDSSSEPKIEYDDRYKEIRKKLSEIEANKISDYYLDENSLSFMDTKIVKDSWEYYLYIDEKKMAFGRRLNFDDFPLKLKEFINYILGITGNLYDISGMS